MLQFAVLQRNLSAVHDIWKDCTKYYTPSIVTLRKFIWSFTRLDDLESAYAVLQHMIVLAAHASLRTSSAGRFQSSRLDIPIPSYGELAHKIFESDGLAYSANILPEARIEIEGAEESCVDRCNKESQLAQNIVNKLSLNMLSVDPSHVRNRIPNMVVKDQINSQVFPSTVDTSRSNTQCLGQEKFAKLNPDNSKQAVAFGILKEKLSRPVKSILRWSFNNVIHACARAKNCELAERLFMLVRIQS